MLIGISVAFFVWAIIFILCVFYALFNKRTYVNASALVLLFVGLLLCGATYGAIVDFGLWIFS